METFQISYAVQNAVQKVKIALSEFHKNLFALEPS